MESPLIYGFALGLSILAISIYWLSNRKSGPGLPPGKLGLPYIGESIEYIFSLHNLHAETFNFKRMAKYKTDRVFKTSVLGDHTAMVCGPEGNNFIFGSGNKSVKRAMPKPLRRLVLPPEVNVAMDQFIKPAYYSLSKLDFFKHIASVMDSMAQQHLDSYWHPLKVIEVGPSTRKFTFTVACRLLLSIEDPDVVDTLYGPVLTWALGLVSMPINLPGTQFYRSLKARKFLRGYLLQIVKQRRALLISSPDDCPKDNILHIYMQACDDDILVTHGVLGIILAGYDLLTSVITMMIKTMSQNGGEVDVYRRVYQENMEIVKEGKLLTVEDTHKLKYTWNVACEVMRIYPPAAIITREALTDLTFDGYYIPKGYKVSTNVYATHRDPKYFPDPLKFDPSRFDGKGPLPYTFTPFGGGPPKCPGLNYSKVMILVFIHNVVKRFKWEAVIPDEKIRGDPTPTPCQGLPVILYPHSKTCD